MIVTKKKNIHCQYTSDYDYCTTFTGNNFDVVNLMKCSKK